MKERTVTKCGKCKRTMKGKGDLRWHNVMVHSEKEKKIKGLEDRETMFRRHYQP